MLYVNYAFSKIIDGEVNNGFGWRILEASEPKTPDDVCELINAINQHSEYDSVVIMNWRFM